MYPKASTKSSGPNKQATREQLSELLINKFRNKYNINVQNERDLDAVVTKEVSRIVMQEAPVGERELNEVDRQIAAAVKAQRGTVTSTQAAPIQHGNDNDDIKSHVSKAVSQASRSKSVASSQVLLNPEAQIRVGMQGKVIGMTDAEWTAQVNENVKQWSLEEQEKRRRLKGQRDQMRTELKDQMQLKQEKQKAAAYLDRQNHNEQLTAIEQKLLEDEIKNKEHDEKIKMNVSINRQFNQLNDYKSEQARAERAKQEAERRILDEQIRNANIHDQRVMDQRRAQLKRLAEEDRKAKALQKALIAAKQQGMPAEDAISSVYEPAEQKSAAFDHVRRVQKPEGRSQLLKSVGASLFVGSKTN